MSTGQISDCRPKRGQAHSSPSVAVDGGPSSAPEWLINPPSESVVRIRATDLQHAQQMRSRLLREHFSTSDEAKGPIVVIADIDFHIAVDARTARRELGALWAGPSDSITYIGTSTGLAGLIVDMKNVGVADGVVLRPILATRSSEIVRQLVDEVIAALQQTNGQRP